MTPGIHACRCLFFAALTGIASSDSITYQNLSVSPFRPAFFGIGIPDGATASRAFAVAATAGVVGPAVGDADMPGFGELPIISLNRQPGFLERGDDAVRGLGLGISGDGKIKVGQSVGAVYWDASNAVHRLDGLLTSPSVVALGISADGSTIAGYISGGDNPNELGSAEAVLWKPGQPGMTRLGQLPDFQHSYAKGLSDNGTVVCGYSTKVNSNANPPTSVTRAYRKVLGQEMQNLGALRANEDSLAYGLSQEGDYAVGTSGSRAVVWDVSHNHMFELSPDSAQSTAYAVRKDCRFPGTIDALLSTSGRIVGATSQAGGPNQAQLWGIQGGKGKVQTLLLKHYQISTDDWELTEATGISADGYTLCGFGVNPAGNQEGWIAVMPPIYYPPRLKNPGPRHATAGAPFRCTIEVLDSNGFVVSSGFGAKGFPAGFTIDAEGVISGTWSPGPSQPKPGVYSVTVTFSNSEGSASTTFQLQLPPPPDFEEIITGQLFLPNAKPAGETAGRSSVSNGISANGSVAVGSDGSTGESRAYRWSAADGVAQLPLLPGALRSYATATATSADGRVIVGQAGTPPIAGVSRAVAVVWNVASAAGVPFAPVTNIGLFPKGIVSVATGVSADGSVVVGYGDLVLQGDPFQAYQAFRWTQAEGMVGLGWLPGGTPNKFSQAFGISADGSTIVGVSNSAGGTQAFRWTQSEGMIGLGRPAGATYGRAVATSANGGAIVGYHTFASGNRAFRWTPAGGMVDLGTLPGDSSSEANALSADGSVVVGRSLLGFNNQHAFIWDPSHGMRDLRSVLVAGNPDLADWQLLSATGMTADGKTIVGIGKNPNGDTEGFTAELHSVMTVTSFSPSNGVPGTSVAVFGTRLATAETVKFNGTAASFVVDSDYQLTATVPAGATTGPIAVTNPSLTATSASNFTVLADADADGMPDDFEQQFFGTPTAADPAADDDGDGQSAREEYLAGTSPLDPTSVLQITDIRREGDATVIVFQPRAGKRYRVEASATLSDSFPFTIATLEASPSDGVREIRDVRGADPSARFYRVALLP